jgi:tRNA (guanine37-N1)-methyltransferase
MRIDVITLFPEMLTAVRDVGISGRAVKHGLVTIEAWNPRHYTHDRHRTVDDRPYGGGPGMVLKFEPLQAALNAAQNAAGSTGPVMAMSPQGRRLDQAWLQELAALPHLILVAGRYEGIDERFMDTAVDTECSLGDYVLSGGELAAMVVIDAVIRLLPGALGDTESANQDSFMDGLLDCPHYTRPEQIDDLTVPPVLLSGDHAAIQRWRLQQALGRTWLRRPDLLAERNLNAEQQALLAEFIQDYFDS